MSKKRLTFLGDGTYQTLVVRDRKDDAAAVEVEQTSQKRGNALTMDLSAGGGYIARFVNE